MSIARDRSASDVADREIVSTRVFDCSRERLFRAWTEPTELTCWWSKRLTTNLAGTA